MCELQGYEPQNAAFIKLRQAQSYIIYQFLTSDILFVEVVHCYDDVGEVVEDWPGEDGIELREVIH